MKDRVKHVVDSCFSGRRIVIFSGGETKTTNELVDEIKGMAAGGGFGSIMGRNAFQRPKKEAIELLHRVQDIFIGS
jgi:class I fructose-bisphosphate aldolase